MIVVTGAGGQLGTAFRKVYPEARFLTRSELDLSNPGAIESVLRDLEPTLLINCAAYTAVDRAEEDADAAFTVNGTAVGELARVTAELGARFVTYSTDYVFDGTGTRPRVESDRTGPINIYGASKLQGEEEAFAAHPQPLVIRTSWVISATHDNFVTAILRAAKTRRLRVVDDQHGCPTIADDLAAGTAEALTRNTGGILHMTNTGSTTWYGLAKESIGLAGIETTVAPCPTLEYPRPAARPANSVLGSERAETLGLTPLPAWEESLYEVIQHQLQRL